MKIIFEDENLLVIDKAPGVVVDKSETQEDKTVEDWLSTYKSNSSLQRNGIVHRLDKDTSGILLVAKTSEALKNLQDQFKERRIKKQYLALAHGFIETGGRVEGDIGRNPGNREKFTVLEGGKEAVTEYEPLERLQFAGERLQEFFSEFNKIQIRKLERMQYNQFTLVSAHPLTGRTHQIRVHLKHIGHPIVSDEKYVGRKMYRLDKRWCPRQFLHASKIGFYDPGSGEWTEVESRLPEDLEKAFANFK